MILIRYYQVPSRFQTSHYSSHPSHRPKVVQSQRHRRVNATTALRPPPGTVRERGGSPLGEAQLPDPTKCALRGEEKRDVIRKEVVREKARFTVIESVPSDVDNTDEWDGQLFARRRDAGQEPVNCLVVG